MAKVFFVFAENTLNTQAKFWQRLVKRGTKAVKVANIKDCDVTLTFCPIVSRVGTDVEAAVQLIPKTTPGVLVLLHHTFNRDEIVPDASRFVRRADILTVNCLFHESELLDSECNDNAFEIVSRYLMRFQRRTASQNPDRHDVYDLPCPPQNQNPGCLYSISPKLHRVPLIIVILIFLISIFILIITLDIWIMTLL